MAQGMQIVGAAGAMLAKCATTPRNRRADQSADIRFSSRLIGKVGAGFR